MKIADDTFLGNSECEWVKESVLKLEVSHRAPGTPIARDHRKVCGAIMLFAFVAPLAIIKKMTI